MNFACFSLFVVTILHAKTDLANIFKASFCQRCFLSGENVKNRKMILKFVEDGIIYPLSDHPGMVFVQKPQEMAKEVLYLALCL